jgi:peptidyl-dipeptidase Dcp
LIRTVLLAGVGAAALTLGACATTGSAPSAPANDVSAASGPAPDGASATAASSNPVVAPWTGPYGGVPPFDKMQPDLVRAGWDEAAAEYRAEIAAVAGDPAAPTFENTIEAYERTGQALGRVNALLGVATSTVTNDAWQKVESELSPLASALSDEVIQNEALFRRIETIWNRRESLNLTPEQRRLLFRTYDSFVRQGAKVAPEDKARLSEVNAELAELYTEFGQKVLADENTWIVVADENELAGLPDSLKASYKAAAEERGVQGWAIVNTRSSVDPFLTYGSDRALRQKVWTAFKKRGDNGDDNDTNATIAKIMPLRAEKARLLGYPTFADWKLGDKMAANPANATRLLETVWAPTKARIQEEVADMARIARADRVNRIEPWDYLYYAEKVRKQKYDLDQNQLKPYFELNRMIDASFYMAERLYGLQMKEITGQLPTWHSDVRVYEVYDQQRGGELIGLFYRDDFARPGKRSGAWMSELRTQEKRYGRVLPIVTNNNNFVKGAAGEPTLISLDDATTLFHEFGHAIHGLVSDVNYRPLAGTATATDFVEMPSQVHENWLLTPEILNTYARHHQTGEPIPGALIEKVRASETFNQGYATGEYMLSAIVDMRMHTVPDGRIDPGAFERQVLAELDAPKEVALRHRLPHFNHLFTSEGYAAGYYSYLWSDTMGADAWKAFEETGDLWDPSTAAKMRAMMAAGDSVDQAELFRRFRGRDPDVNALLQNRGFPPVAK